MKQSVGEQLRSQSHDRKAAGGFTLVELLVVIGIIALLIAILLPALNKAREQAKTVQCLSNARQIAMVILLYANENKGNLPLFAPDVNSPISLHWQHQMAPYFNRNGEEVGRDVMRCPSVDGWYTYGVNYTAIMAPPIFTYGNALGTDARYKGSGKLGQIKPSTILLMHANMFYVFNPAWWTLDNAPDNDSNSNILSIYGYKYNFADFQRHHMTSNAAFGDGSAHNVRLDEWKNNKDQMWGYPTP